MTKHKKCILLVDDEAAFRMGLRDRIETEGYEVRSADGGKEALELVEQMNFDLIILDLLMPHPNGFEVFRRFKELSVTSRTPILILTAVGLEPQVQTLLKDGAHHLQKRKTAKGIISKIEELISRSDKGPGS